MMRRVLQFSAFIILSLIGSSQHDFKVVVQQCVFNTGLNVPVVVVVERDHKGRVPRKILTQQNKRAPINAEFPTYVSESR